MGVAAEVFFAGAEGVAGEGAVDGEDAVEVVHFVLDEFGEGAGGREFAGFSGSGEVAQAEGGVSLETDHEVGEGEAVVPKGEFVLAEEGEFGVDQFIADASDFEEDDAEGDADLDGGDAAPEAVGAAELAEGGVEVAEDEEGVVGGGDGGGDGAEEGVAELEDAAGRHHFYSIAVG